MTFTNPIVDRLVRYEIINILLCAYWCESSWACPHRVAMLKIKNCGIPLVQMYFECWSQSYHFYLESRGITLRRSSPNKVYGDIWLTQHFRLSTWSFHTSVPIRAVSGHRAINLYHVCFTMICYTNQLLGMLVFHRPCPVYTRPLVHIRIRIKLIQFLCKRLNPLLIGISLSGLESTSWCGLKVDYIYMWPSMGKTGIWDFLWKLSLMYLW